MHTDLAVPRPVMPAAVVTGGASGLARAAEAARTLPGDESPDRA